MDSKLIEQAIENCFLTKKYEYPGMENGMCAGLRTCNGEGEPLGQCKECKLQYQYQENQSEDKSNELLGVKERDKAFMQCLSCACIVECGEEERPIYTDDDGNCINWKDGIGKQN